MGVLRLLLALSVAAGHTASKMFGFDGVGPTYAVDFFFIISGFYMAMVLNESYVEPSPTRFYLSRVLRLAPIYYIGVVFSLAVSWNYHSQIFHALSRGGRTFYLFENLFVFGQDWANLACVKMAQGGCFEPAAALVIDRSTWSLAPELCFYLIAPFIVRSIHRITVLLLVGAASVCAVSLLQYPVPASNLWRELQLFYTTYFFLPCTMIYFALGALSYHLSKARLEHAHYIAIIVAFAVIANAPLQLPAGQAVLFAAAVPVIFRLTADMKWDRFLGELSYPVYILHLPTFDLVMTVARTHPKLLEFATPATIVVTMCCAAGVALLLAVERPVDRFRHNIRSRQKPLVCGVGAALLHDLPVGAIALETRPLA
jgi:peptidoglycan/LPS O-acetylase OafA/YrhL